MSERYDVVIVGAGMVGATLAAVLADSDLRVLLLDRSQPREFDYTTVADLRRYDLRVSAVNLAAEQLFSRIGAWSDIERGRTQPFQRMQVWDAAGRGRTTFDAATVGEPHLGSIVENSLINHAVLLRALAAPNIDVLWDASPQQLRLDADYASVELDTGQSLRAKLVVGADGGRSHIRRLSGIKATTHDYQQRTLVGLVRTEQPHQNTAWQRFLSTGPIALLPLADRLCSLAWHLDRERAIEIEALDEREFSSAMSEQTDYVLGDVELAGPRGGFDLFRMHANHYVHDRVALIGDAAHVIHPLAGLGVNLGFMDAAVLGECLRHNRSADAGDGRTLRRYARRRRLENTLAVMTTDAFKHGFGASGALIQDARNLGLNLADRAGPVKQQVLRYAMGLSGDLPALAKR